MQSCLTGLPNLSSQPKAVLTGKLTPAFCHSATPTATCTAHHAPAINTHPATQNQQLTVRQRVSGDPTSSPGARRRRGSACRSARSSSRGVPGATVRLLLLLPATAPSRAERGSGGRPEAEKERGTERPVPGSEGVTPAPLLLMLAGLRGMPPRPGPGGRLTCLRSGGRRRRGEDRGSTVLAGLSNDTRRTLLTPRDITVSSLSTEAASSFARALSLRTARRCAAAAVGPGWLA